MKKMNKKGAVPIGEALLMVWDTIPRPIKMFFFLFLLVVISSFVFPTMVKFFGYECATDRSGSINLYKIPTENLLRSAVVDVNNVIRKYIIGVDEYRMPEDPFPDGDATYLRVPQECIVNTEINGTPVMGYTAQCSNCSFEPKTTWWGWFGSDANGICVGDGYYEEGTALDKNKFLEARCKQCSPPSIDSCDTEYYFNISNCQNPPYNCYFTLVNESKASCIDPRGLAISDYYEKIISLGGVKQEQSSDSFVNVQCVDEGKPAPFMFSVELFNRTMWIILLIASFLIPLAWGWYNVTLKF